MTEAAIDLGGGLSLRTAVDGDLDQIVALEVGAFGPPDEPGILAAVEEAGGMANWAVVVDGAGRVVSASALLDHTLEIDGVPVPAGQVEWVATEPGYQRRGLVRAQFERHHALAAERGHLVVLIGGIPYLYRRFGYGYGLDHPTLYLFDAAALGERVDPAGTVVRPATEADLEALTGLEAHRPRRAVRLRRDDAFWRRQLASARGDRARFEQVVVAEQAGTVTGWARAKIDRTEANRVYLEPAVTTGPAASDALVAHFAALAAGDDLVLVGFDTPGNPHGARLAELGSPISLFPGYYARVPDPVALLDRLAPVLSARLAASERHAAGSRTVELSFYERGAAIDVVDGEVGAVRPIAGVEDPLAHDFGIGVAPDQVGALVLGRFGAQGLAERADDVVLGRHAGIMEVLFPALPADVAADL